ncbi:serine hydrolase [Paenibacillus hemerocallicola]|uniref:Serine hydrolase n=1 Tax=Paenibacillus hemerocallicola TaxID=1172614 RepID=A0A5C4SXN6_9BACL|nr:serine hydrolase [Paenibacillus hemerocallicola]TNJ60033.1 serine hydrolase [Paenibacillus hemerocallicola]
MHRIEEAVPFTVMEPKATQLDALRLNQAYETLLQTFPSLYSLLIVKDAQLVFERYEPPVKPTAAYSIKSITKSVMNALVGIAIQDGLIASVDQLISDLALKMPEKWLANIDGVTVKHLLTMTHGLHVEENSQEMLEVWKSSNWIGTILDKPLVHSPGERFLYCTCTTHLLSAILTQAVKVPLAYYASRKLFWPLGIQFRRKLFWSLGIQFPVRWEQAPEGLNWGGNNMFLTPRILARFGQLYLADGIWNGQRLLPAGWVDESFEKHSTGWSGYAAYGYLWWVGCVDGLNYAFASGYGGQYVYVIPELKSVIVLTANSDASIAEMQATTNPVIKDPTWILRRFLIESRLPEI